MVLTRRQRALRWIATAVVALACSLVPMALQGRADPVPVQSVTPSDSVPTGCSCSAPPKPGGGH